MNVDEFSQQCPRATQIDEDGSLPSSFPSQPPDIRNWFSSYEYESPDCSDASYVLEVASKELLLNDLAEVDRIPNKEEKLTENENPSSSEESSQNVNSLELNCWSPEGIRHLPWDKEYALKGNNKERTNGTDDIWPSKMRPTQKIENFMNINKENHGSLNNTSNHNVVLQYREAFSKPDDCQLKGKQNSQQLGRSINEEQKEVMAENGFISTKNRDVADKQGENSKAHCLIVNGKRSRFELQEDDVVSQKERPFSVRGVLTEKTNVCFAEEAIKAEAIGKWQFPRKSKPYAGPPLKQLRLERWVRRAG
ncbi:uncharacterized protein LOC110028643 [Phalaenopsis equestris]|uniref:uncharacterized protein LOC110028643 n=1 Tax=Phalaenopsis equestris TaxID=78828 RepID=UPI0009E4BFA4|nr:uncharacterized protein LOC110028643 [Phalaenopsis equestris]